MTFITSAARSWNADARLADKLEADDAMRASIIKLATQIEKTNVATEVNDKPSTEDDLLNSLVPKAKSNDEERDGITQMITNTVACTTSIAKPWKSSARSADPLEASDAKRASSIQLTTQIKNTTTSTAVKETTATEDDLRSSLAPMQTTNSKAGPKAKPTSRRARHLPPRARGKGSRFIPIRCH